MLDSGYLRDLGGLDAHRALARLDLRGTGASDAPTDPASYRCDRQVADVEAVRRHLGLERLDLLAHSAGANLAYAYAAAHPDRVARLVLVAPSVRGLGIEITDEARSEIARLRAGRAVVRRGRGRAGPDPGRHRRRGDWAAISPFMYGRWDDDVRAYEAWMDERRDDEKAMAFGADGAFDPEPTRARPRGARRPGAGARRSADSGNPVPVMAEVAAVFPRAELRGAGGRGSLPVGRRPERFARLLAAFLSD